MIVFKCGRSIAAIAKRASPKAIVIVGYFGAPSIPDILLKNSRVDIAVMREADRIMISLLQALKNETL